MKHILSISDLTKDEILGIIYSALELKEKRQAGKITDLLKNKSLGMIFEKSSTRTRISFEVGMADLGGHALYLSTDDMQLGRGETIEDTASVISRYLHAITARVYSHDTVEELARHSSVPVINALSDKEHPCQLLSDLMTIIEYKGNVEGLKFAWIGDGNNVCNSAILMCAIMGMQIVVACPKGYEPDEDIVQQAIDMGGDVTITDDVQAAAKRADVLYTDVWVSMGDEDERDKRLKDLAPYQINAELVGHAKNDCIVLHCLPAHRGEEITEDVMKGVHSAILDQAENRLHAQKALIVSLIAEK